MNVGRCSNNRGRIQSVGFLGGIRSMPRRLMFVRESIRVTILGIRGAYLSRRSNLMGRARME